MNTQCSVKVYPADQWGAFHPHQCLKKATVEREGKHYCTIHDPEYVKEESKKRRAKWDEQIRQARLFAAAPDLLKACEMALKIGTTYPPDSQARIDSHLQGVLRQAIAKAKGEL